MARPKSGRRSMRLSVTLNEDDHKAIRDIAEALGVSTAWVVRRAVSEFVERHNKEDGLPLRNRNERTA